MNFLNAEFVKSAAGKNDFIYDGKPQIVFAGRSNVGKSSVINKIVNRKNFARISSVPGKTAHINYFLINKTLYFTDLPGYGYAKVPEAEKKRWSELMEGYFATVGIITAGILIVDSRHRPTADDAIMAGWFKNSNCPFIIVANKADKLKKSETEESLRVISDTLELSEDTKVILFSAQNGIGRAELIEEMNKFAP